MSTTIAHGTAEGLRPLAAGEARWTSGFWHDVQQRTFEVTVPTMGADLHDDTVSPAWRNFLIAAGRAEGRHGGPPFLDGDFYKWLEAAISQFESVPTPALESGIDEAIELISATQREDGYLHTATLIAARNHEEASALADRFHFETYNLGHLISAAVRHHRVTGRTDFLAVGERAAAFMEGLAADAPVELARSAICPSHYMAVIDLYRATGDARWLRLAEAFVRVRDDFDGGDDNQDRVPVREQVVVAGHAVRANYLYAGLADLIAETGDAELGDVVAALWQDVVDTKLAVTGGCGALYDGASPDGDPWQEEISRIHQAYGRPYQLPHTTAHNETCANIGMVLWSERMLALTADARYADLIERVLYNSVLSGSSLDGDAYNYTNPLRQVRDLPFALRMPGDTGLTPVPPPPPSDERLRERYLSCFCCPPNLARTLARLHEFAASVNGDGVHVHLYGGSDIDIALAGDGRFALTERSDYPWDGRIELTVTAADAVTTLRLRIPDWAAGATVTVADGEPALAEPGTYHAVKREWMPGDRVVIDLPMPVRLLRGHRLAEEVANQVAVARGPLVYAVESPDLSGDVRIEQLALRRGTVLEPHGSELAGHRIVELTGDAVVLPAAVDQLYSTLSDEPLGTTPLRLIPYFAWGNRGPSEMSVWMPVVW